MKTGTKRTYALLAIGGVLVGALAITPAWGHVSRSVTHLWGEHIKPRADTRYEEETFVKVGKFPQPGGSFSWGGTVWCPAGHEAIAGGVAGDDSSASVTHSGPNFGGPSSTGPTYIYLNNQPEGRYGGTARGWTGFMKDDGGGTLTVVTVSVTCARQ